jgi:hypothetical protein
MSPCAKCGHDLAEHDVYDGCKHIHHAKASNLQSLDLITRSQKNMDFETIDAARRLIDFARSHAHHVYGAESDDALENEKAIILASDILASYLSIVLGDDEKGDAAKYIDEPQGEAEQ